jgi:3'(2'), 5'-bisphosphate nucleotidase
MPWEKELEVALQAAEAAGRLVLEHYDRLEAIPDAPSDISTEADRAAQELILRHILDAFPADRLCAEEKTPTLEKSRSTSSRLWIVDPIDGTRGFARKNGEFSVMVGFVESGRMMAGVVLEPAVWRCTYATQGGGCWRYSDLGGERKRCHVGKTTQLSEATLTQSRSKTARESPVVRTLQPARILETYSAGLKLAQVASGEADIYVNIYPEFHDWDICAGHILVEEAGGKVTTLAGEPIVYGSEGFKQRAGMLASNGALHAAAVEFLKSMKAATR